jgi:hypothetical protein
MNPMGIGPTWQGNYQQPDVANPAPNPQVEAALGLPANGNPMELPAALPKYSQPDTVAHPSAATILAVPNGDVLKVAPNGVAPTAYQQPGDILRSVSLVPPAPGMNPLGLNSGVATPPYEQPNASNPAPNPNVGIVPVLHGDPLGLGNNPRPVFMQTPDATKNPEPTVVSDVSSATGVVLLE